MDVVSVNGFADKIESGSIAPFWCALNKVEKLTGKNALAHEIDLDHTKLEEQAVPHGVSGIGLIGKVDL